MPVFRKKEISMKQINLDIVDAQIHFGPGKIEEILASMDALGIRSVVVDEYWLKNFFSYDPHHVLENGEIRPICPTAELAALLYPDRFAWMLRINPRDPQYRSMVRWVKEAPSGRAVRLIPGMNPMDIQAFASGEYDAVLAAAQQEQVPVSLYLPDQPQMIADTARKFPELKLIVDHCGLYNNAMRTGLSGAGIFTREEQMDMFNQVLKLSDCHNVALKWAHYSSMFEIPAFPGTGLWPVLRKTISAFGPERILWASDFSVNQAGENWGELLYSMKANADLTQEEMAAILGGNARRWLGWTIAETGEVKR